MPHGVPTATVCVQRGGRHRESAYRQLARVRPRDYQLIGEFVSSLGILSKRRVDKFNLYLGKIAMELGKPFEEATVEDLKGYIASSNASSYTDLTKRDVRLITKKFYRWLRNDEFVDDGGKETGLFGYPWNLHRRSESFMSMKVISVYSDLPRLSRKGFGRSGLRTASRQGQEFPL